jgi:hypothetical protein
MACTLWHTYQALLATLLSDNGYISHDTTMAVSLTQRESALLFTLTSFPCLYFAFSFIVCRVKFIGIRMVVCGLLHRLRQYIFFRRADTTSCLHLKGDWIMFQSPWRKKPRVTPKILKKIFFYIIIIIVVTNIGFFLLCVAFVALLSVALLSVCRNLDLISS